MAITDPKGSGDPTTIAVERRVAWQIAGLFQPELVVRVHARRAQRGCVCVVMSSRTHCGQWHSGLLKAVTEQIVATVPPLKLRLARCATVARTPYNARRQQTDVPVRATICTETFPCRCERQGFRRPAMANRASTPTRRRTGGRSPRRAVASTGLAPVGPCLAGGFRDCLHQMIGTTRRTSRGEADGRMAGARSIPRVVRPTRRRMPQNGRWTVPMPPVSTRSLPGRERFAPMVTDIPQRRRGPRLASRPTAGPDT